MQKTKRERGNAVGEIYLPKCISYSVTAVVVPLNGLSFSLITKSEKKKRIISLNKADDRLLNEEGELRKKKRKSNTRTPAKKF